jgi:hypothetical protein
MEEALDQVRRLATASQHSRQQAILALQDLAFSLETPDFTLHRYGHMVWLTSIVAQDED